LLDYLARLLVFAQQVSLVDPDTVDHFTTVACYHVEQVIHHFGLLAVLLHFRVESGVHVHGHRLDLLALFAEQLEERANRLTAVAVANQQHPRPLGIHDRRGIAMAFVQGELVHYQATHLSGLERANRCVQTALVERFEGVPVQANEAADVADW
jgi:hypothetical protein